MIDLTIIAPVFHEEDNIVELFDTIRKKVKTQNEIVVVYDLDDDPTVKVIKNYLLKNKGKNIILIKNNTGDKKGVINAIKSGLKIAKGKAVAIVVADLSDDLTTIDKMYKKIEKGYDVVCGSRYMTGGQKNGGPLLKTYLSKIAGLSLNRVFKLPTHDATNAFKIYRKELFKNIPIESTGGFEYSLEVTLKAFKKGYKISEVPTRWIDREKGKSNFKFWKWLPKYIITYLLIISFDNKLILRWEKWAKKVQNTLSNFQLTLMLAICLLISSLAYIFLARILNLKFVTQQTTAINWLTVNHYPKQQDYYLFFSLFGFTFISSLIIWFIWINLKLRK